MADRMFLHRAVAGDRRRSGSSSFKEFPIRQKPASFNLDEVMRKLTPPGS